jgi:tRNA threonylcarbamoyladenosine biosynthesis protein TsaB
MALILNIDTALDSAYISLAENERGLGYAINETTKDHAAWIQPAIYKLIKESGWKMADLAGVGVSIGPGSYTGLRIGLSTAKGLCFALKIPLVTINTLEIMAFSAVNNIAADDPDLFSRNLFICPMIDARRMEVFTAVYNSSLMQIYEPHTRILDELAFDELLGRQKILFLGNGSIKFQQVCHNANAIFKKLALNPFALSELTYKNFIGNNFATLAYAEPLYLKEFFTNQPETGKPRLK